MVICHRLQQIRTQQAPLGAFVLGCYQFQCSNTCFGMHVQELAEEFGRHRAKEFNVGVERKDTGVRYEDVAGIDNIKEDIEEVMKMVLGNDEYRAIGARPPRVSKMSKRA